MARRTQPGSDAVYAAADLFVDRCLRTGTSLFTPERRIWSSEAFGNLRGHFVEQPLTDERSFMLKLRQQLSGLKDPAVQLMAELLFVHFLITLVVSGRKKREILQEVLGWMKEPAAISGDLQHALDQGLVNPGHGAAPAGTQTALR